MKRVWISFAVAVVAIAGARYFARPEAKRPPPPPSVDDFRRNGLI